MLGGNNVSKFLFLATGLVHWGWSITSNVQVATLAVLSLLMPHFKVIEYIF